MSSQISYHNRFRPFASAIGLGPSQSQVLVSGESLSVKMGWAFRAEIPLSSVASVSLAEDVPWYWGVGAHVIGKNTWIMNGTLKNLVEIDMEQLVPARVAGLKIQLLTLFVSVQDPQELISELSSRGR
jgi:hypothetical protein